jgi:hypothetical protein
MTQLSGTASASKIAEFLGRRRSFLVLYAVTAVVLDYVNQVNVFFAGIPPIYELPNWITGYKPARQDTPVVLLALLGPMFLIWLARKRGRRVNKPNLIIFPILSFGYTIAVPALAFGLGLFPVPLWWVLDALCLINGQADVAPE